MRVRRPHTPSDGRLSTAADSKPGRSRDFTRLLAVILAACLGIALLAWPNGTRSARQRDPASATVNPTSGLAGSTFSVSAAGFAAFANGLPAFILFDVNGQPVTIGQTTIVQCFSPFADSQVYGFGAGCGPDVLVMVPADAALGPNTVTVHVPNANPILKGGPVNLQTTYSVIAPDTPTPTSTDTATPTITDTPTATDTSTNTPTDTATTTATGVASASPTNTVLATAISTPSAPSTPEKATATNTATATATSPPSRPVSVLVQPLFSIGKLLLAVRGQPLARVNISLAIERSQQGALAAVYRLTKTGTLDTMGGFSTALFIAYHGRGVAALTVAVHGPSKTVRLSRTYRYSG
jgi:hypothetical protein